jgi:hypothetical protein
MIKPSEPRLECCPAEVHEQPGWASGYSEISNHLGDVVGMYGFTRLELDYDTVLDQQVEL